VTVSQVITTIGYCSTTVEMHAVKYKGIAEIKAFTTDKEVNKWLARGWELLAVPGNGSPSYIVGRPEIAPKGILGEALLSLKRH